MKWVLQKKKDTDTYRHSTKKIVREKIDTSVTKINIFSNAFNVHKFDSFVFVLIGVRNKYAWRHWTIFCCISQFIYLFSYYLLLLLLFWSVWIRHILLLLNWIFKGILCIKCELLGYVIEYWFRVESRKNKCVKFCI